MAKRMRAQVDTITEARHALAAELRDSVPRCRKLRADRLYSITQALGAEVGYFFEGLQSPDRFVPSPQQRMLLDIARHY